MVTNDASDCAERSGNDFLGIGQCLMKDPPVPSQTLASGRAGLLAALPSSPGPPLPKSHPWVRVRIPVGREEAGGSLWPPTPCGRGVPRPGREGGAGAVGRAPADDAG